MKVAATACLLWVLMANGVTPRTFPFAREYGTAEPPTAAAQFCRRQPSVCAGGPTGRITPSDAQWDDLYRVNVAMNYFITPEEDAVLYGVTDYWANATTAGDCEDYAIAKREELVRRGWPRGALLLAVAWSGRDWHAVLIAATTDGDYILDNQTNEIWLWNETRLEFFMRQSVKAPAQWVYLE